MKIKIIYVLLNERNKHSTPFNVHRALMKNLPDRKYGFNNIEFFFVKSLIGQKFGKNARKQQNVSRMICIPIDRGYISRY